MTKFKDWLKRVMDHFETVGNARAAKYIRNRGSMW